jgi:hypothetical protein
MTAGAPLRTSITTITIASHEHSASAFASIFYAAMLTGYAAMLCCLPALGHPLSAPPCPCVRAAVCIACVAAVCDGCDW